MIGLPNGLVAAQDNSPEAAVQAEVKELTVGILAGSLKPGSTNGFRTDATFAGPRDICVDSSGNVFLIDGSAIRKITPDGRVSTFAGSTSGYADGQGVTALFGPGLGIAIDANDNIYLADAYNRKIRKITPDGYVSTLAGSTSGYRDGWGADAQFTLPRGIAADAMGNVYVGDDKNNKIRRITPDGEVTTLAQGAAIEFTQPRSLSVDASGNVYVLDGIRMKKITPDGNVLLMAANMKFEPAANEDNRAKFAGSGGIAVDSDGNLYVTNTTEKTLVKISPEGHVSTVAENNAAHWIGRPNSVAIGANGNFYLADEHNHLVHQVTPAGNVGPLPGSRIPKATVAQSPGTPGETEAPAMTKKEQAELIAITKKKAKKDVEAQFALATMYFERGRGLNDKLYAAKWFKKAAKAGHAGAQYEHGRRHLNGEISYSLTITNGDVAAAEAKQLAKRQAAAVDWYTKSADQGYAKAQHALAWMYLNGEGVPQSNDKAIELLSKAGAQGHFDAQFELGEIYRKGQITDTDYAKAIEWYSMASEQGDFYSTAIRNALVRATDESNPVKQIYVDAEAQTDLGLKYYAGEEVEQDYAKAVELFEGAAMLGTTTAQWMLGVMYFNGEGVAQNSKQSVAWHTIAAELGHADAQFRLGFLYDKGYGVSKNTALAVDWYTKPAEQGNLNAQFSLGHLLYHGAGVKADHASSLTWYDMAAEHGDAQAQYNAGSMYLAGYGANRDGARAIELFEKAAAQGHPGATKLLPVYKKAVNGDAVSQYSLGRIYQDGREIQKDEHNALEWFKKSAEQGFGEAQYSLGMMYRHCCGEIKQNYESAIAWLEIAAAGGHASAKTELEKLLAQIDREEYAGAEKLVKSIVRLIKSHKK